jgi:hypothetical protein
MEMKMRILLSRILAVTLLAAVAQTLSACAVYATPGRVAYYQPEPVGVVVYHERWHHW